MRDPKRIRKFCNQLADIWESQCPDWRFGQLISNVFSGDGMFFYREENEMMECCKKYFHLGSSEDGEHFGDSEHQ